MEVLRHSRHLLLIRGFLSQEACSELIEYSEDAGYEEARIHAGHGAQRIVKDVRNNDRLFWDNQDLARAWFERAESVFPRVHERWAPSGLNERFRFYRYGAGHRFAQHRDGSYQRNANEMSWYTFMVYLNDDYAGGRTRFDFANSPNPIAVQPEAGAALLFHHDLLHEGESVIAGRKYVLRTDVMYQRQFPTERP